MLESGMRRAFVVQLSNQAVADPLQGSVEEVDTGREARFSTEEELIEVLREGLNGSSKNAGKERSLRDDS